MREQPHSVPAFGQRRQRRFRHEIRQRLVENGFVAGHARVFGGGPAEPEQVVGSVRARAQTRAAILLEKEPMQHVAPGELLPAMQ